MTPSRILRKVALGLVAGVLALTWAQSGMTQDCIVVRGQDPLDVLQLQVKHNVWFILDGSGSMSNPFAGSSVRRVEEAVDVIEGILDTFVDASGEPLVNWGFRYFLCNDRSSCGVSAAFEGSVSTDQCTNQFQSTCGGLIKDAIEPPACLEPHVIDDIKGRLSIVENNNRGLTPNGISLDQLSKQLESGFVSTLLPGQKNFIILLTDGWDTCECNASIWDGNPTPALRNDPLDPTPGDPVFVPPRQDAGDCDGNGNTTEIRLDDEAKVRAYNAGLKASDAFLRINGGDATAGLGDIWVVGMGLGGEACFPTPQDSQSLINHLAWEASGVSVGNPTPHGALFANNRDELEDKLLDVLSNIAVPTTEVKLGSDVTASVKELAYLSDGTGALTTEDFLADGGGDLTVINRRNYFRNNIEFTTSVELPGWKGHFRATKVYEEAADGTRSIAADPIWDAGEKLQARDPDDRQILFNRAVPVGTVPPAPIPFDTANVVPGDLGVAAGFLSDLDPTGVGAVSGDDAAAIVIGIVRGKRLVVNSTNGFYTDATRTTLSLVETDLLGENTWKLYDITSAPAINLAPPRSATADPPNPVAEYGEFFDLNINRQTIAYLSSNGGMVHAFRADNGFELYGYIPHDVLPRLQDFVRKIVSDTMGIANHEFFMASSPTVADAFLQPSVNNISEWRTVLSVGRGRGGKFMSSIDITTVGNWDGNAPDDVLPDGFEPPRLLFTVGNNDGVVDLDNSGDPENNYDGMGETWSLPAMGRVRAANVEGQWVAFFGGGYGCTASDEGKFFYVLKLEDGSIYAKFGPIQDVVGPGDVGIDENALVASPTLYNPHEPGRNDGLDFVTRAYIGDLQGFVYKLVAEDPDPENWVFDVLFEVTSEEDPAAGEHNQPITARASLVKLATESQVVLFVGTGGDQRVQLEEPDRFKMVGIVDNGDFDGQLFSTTEDTGVGIGVPWFFDLPEGERVTAAPVAARNGPSDAVVFFASSRLEFDVEMCTGGFASTLTALTVNGGLGAFDLDPSVGGNVGTLDLGEGKVTGLYHRDEHLYVSMSGGIGFPSETRIYGSDTFPAPNVGDQYLQLLVETFRMSPF